MLVKTRGHREAPINWSSPLRRVPWTPEEELVMAEGFIDMDLEGDDLRRHMETLGYVRSVAAIDQRLRHLNYCMPQENTSSHRAAIARQRSRLAGGLRRAQETLANQIRLARAEMSCRSPAPYKSGPLEW